nr:hypothetical protein [Chryseobacterium piperi]
MHFLKHLSFKKQGEKYKTPLLKLYESIAGQAFGKQIFPVATLLADSNA